MTIPLVVIVGVTASGKSALALKIAKLYNGEIIAADSRTVYKGLDIGTAKPSRQEQEDVPHHLVDVVDPDESFTLWDFQQQARSAIEGIRSRGKLPILVGGTGLYIDSIIFDYKLCGKRDNGLRASLEKKTVESLQMMIKEQHIELPGNAKNKRHLIRALELGKINNSRRSTIIDDCIVVGISTDKSDLDQRIRLRIKKMFAEGVINEAQLVAKKYGWDINALTGNIYQLSKAVLCGQMALEDAVEEGVALDCKLAKRQRTWFRRNPYIVWGNVEATKANITKALHRAGYKNVLI